MKGQIWRAANEDFHRSLKQPVLLIEGDDDKFVPIEDAIDMVKVINYLLLSIF
jgi:dipeptidyl aminopeptidase/acylaminoacyl peptidase